MTDERRPGESGPERPTGERAPTPPEYGETWVYESIVGAIPGLDLSDAAAVTVQVVLFEGLVLAFAAVYDLWDAVPAGTAAVVVAAAGSYAMLALGAQLRGAQIPEAYRRLVFSASIEVVLAVLSFVALLTYLFAVDPRRGGPTLLTALLGERPPVSVIYLTLLVLWDLCYRIGTGWWASITGLWRTVRYGDELDATTRGRLLRADLLTVGFGLVQLALVPFVSGHDLLVVALLGHVLAVTVVSGASAVLLARS